MRIFKLVIKMGILLFFCNTGNSQELVSNGGDNFETLTGSISWSLGEIAIETLSADSIVLTQGFQQSCITIGALHKYSEEIRVQCRVYPVPATDYITVEMDEYHAKFYLVLYDICGEEVIRERIKSQETKIVLNHLPASDYILRIISNEKIIKSFKIIKF
ncbi:MAG: T9SS type A sorting domain-containing protein [Bacteroidales bacterium]|nr:T9SS type A sorting domain-containing protein [Bacteroidales bacterium]